MTHFTHHLQHDYPSGGPAEGKHPCWATVTHTPSMSSVRLYSGHHTSAETLTKAQDVLTAMLADWGDDACLYGEVVDG